jgi:hypothetical protein
MKVSAPNYDYSDFYSFTILLKKSGKSIVFLCIACLSAADWSF